MEQGGLKVNQKDIARHHVLRVASEGRLILTEAAEKLGISYRQAKRMRKSFEQEWVPILGEQRSEA